MPKKILFSFPVWGKFFSLALHHWSVSLLPTPGQKREPWLMGMEGCQEHETSTYISGHKKAVNWLDIEQQLFYNNCPPYLHPVPVPGVYNGSMYPKCLYSDEPGVTQFKRLFFPLPGMAPKIGICSHFKEGLPKKSKHLFLILPTCWSTERTPQVWGERSHHSWFPFLQEILELQGAFPDSFPGTASWNANAEKPCFAQSHMCSHTRT